MRVCFIESCWQKDIVADIRRGFVVGVGEAVETSFVSVPGIFEIPLQAKLVAKDRTHDAIIAAGVIVTGGVYQYHYVASSVIHALMNIQLDFEIPIISALLTPLDTADVNAKEYLLKHAEMKGTECAAACLSVLGLLRDRRVRDRKTTTS